jgi:hypothetical protein
MQRNESCVWRGVGVSLDVGHYSRQGKDRKWVGFPQVGINPDEWNNQGNPMISKVRKHL